jgi:hypothetical protein
MNRAVRIATGTITKVAIDAGSSYLLQNFTLQSDMGANAALWNANVVVMQRAELRTALSGKTTGQGYLTGGILFDVMTFGMVSFFKTTFFSGGVLSAAATFKLYDNTDTAQYIQGILYQPDWQSVTQIAIGYTDVLWQIAYGVDIT